MALAIASGRIGPSADPAHQLNPSLCQADFAYTMILKKIKIQDTGKGRSLLPMIWKRFCEKSSVGTTPRSPATGSVTRT
jgi:hypothetical protein